MKKRVSLVLSLAYASCAPGNQTGPGVQKQDANRMQAAAAAPSPVVAPNETFGATYDHKYLHLECKIENEALNCDIFLRDTNQNRYAAKIKEENITKETLQEIQIEQKDGESKYLPVSKIHDDEGWLTLSVNMSGLKFRCIAKNQHLIILTADKVSSKETVTRLTTNLSCSD